MSDRRKQLLMTGIVLGAVGALASMAFSLKIMSDRIETLSMEMSNLRSSIMSQVTNESSSIKEVLETTNAPLIFKEVSYGSFDEKSWTLDASVVITPRVSTDGMTVDLSYGDQKTPMTAHGTGFKGVLKLPVFNDDQIIAVINDGNRHESIIIESYNDLWRMNVINLMGRFEGSMVTTNGSDVYRYTGDIFLDNVLGAGFEADIQVISERDGVVRTIKTEHKTFEGSTDSFPISFEVKKPEEYHKLSLEIKDRRGVTYVILLQNDVIDSSGVMHSNMGVSTGNISLIKDDAGKHLFEFNE